MAKLPTTQAQPLTIADASALAAAGAVPLPVVPTIALHHGAGVTTDKGYWRSPGMIVPRQSTGRRPNPLRAAPPPLLTDTPPGRFYPELGVISQLPPWQDPSYHAEPLDSVFSCPSVPWYNTWTTVQTFEVESGWMYVIRGLCFEWGGIPLGDVFELMVVAGGATLCTVQSMRISADVNPAYQYAIGGPMRPVPVWGVADQTKSVQVRVRVLGPQATDGSFSKTNSDPLGISVTTSLIGWRAPRVDTRTGGPLPGDVFPATDGVEATSRYDLDGLRETFAGRAV